MQEVGRIKDFKNIYSAGFSCGVFFTINISGYLGYNMFQSDTEYNGSDYMCDVTTL